MTVEVAVECAVCGHADKKHVKYSASYKDQYGSVIAIRDHIVCIGYRCRCERPGGLYPGTVTR